MNIDSFLTRWVGRPRFLKHRALQGTPEYLQHHSTVIYRISQTPEGVSYGLINTTRYTVSTASIQSQLRRILLRVYLPKYEFLRFDREEWGTVLKHDIHLLYQEYKETLETCERLLGLTELTKMELRRVLGFRDYYHEEFSTVCRILKKPVPECPELFDLP